MQQLEKQFYSREEIAELLTIKITDHFKRDVTNKLDKWGYQYKYSCKGVEIIAAPATAQDKLKEIMIRQFNLDIQVDVYAFACFVKLLIDYEDFMNMPWEQRAKEIKEIYNVSVDKKTLERWSNKLISKNLIAKGFERVYWSTSYINGKKERIRVDGDLELEAEMAKYMARKKELTATSKDFNENFAILWKEFGCCYYSCSSLVLNAIDADIEEICNLVDEIHFEKISKKF